MRLEDDDFEDFSNDGYADDEIVDEVLAALNGKVSSSEAEAALDRVDWDVDAAIAALQAKLAPLPKPKPKLKPAPNVPSLSTENPKGKLSRLQALAQQRKEVSEPSTGGTGALSRLSALRLKNSSDENSLSSKLRQARSQAPPVSNLSASGKLAEPALRSSTSQPPLSPFLDIQSPRKPDHQSPSELRCSSQSENSATETTLDFAYTHVDLMTPGPLGRLLERHTFPSHQTVSNAVPVAPHAASNFANPSPDERIQTAQEGAFASTNSATAKISTSGTQQGSRSSKHTPAQSSLKPAKPGKKVKTLTVEELESRVSKLNVASQKPSLAFVVIGHVDTGKSTLMGRILLDSGAISRKLVEKYERESARDGKSSFALAWVMDATTEERRRGVTVDISEATFESKSTRFVVVDAPGHRDYVPNMIAGVGEADVAVLVIDASPNAFESGFSLDGQTKEHALLARSLGIDTVVVAVNKMDTQDWQQSRFEEIEVQLQDFLIRSLGFVKAIFIPTSGRDGTNVVKKATIQPLSWYTGPTLVGALDELAATRPRKALAAQPFRFLVSNAYKEAHQSATTVAGRVLTGTLQAGDFVEIVAAAATESHPVAVKSLVDDNILAAGSVGEFRADFPDDVHPGDVIAAVDAGLAATTQIEAKIRLFDIPRPLLVGTQLSLHMGRIDVSASVSKILGALDKSGNILKDKRPPRHLGRNSSASVVVMLKKPVVMSPPSISRELGRFVLRLNGQTVGGGVVQRVIS